MKAYAFDSNGFYVSTFAPQLDPLETAKRKMKIYLIPPHATPLPPPTLGEGEVARWLGSAWAVEAFVQASDPSIPDPGFKVPEITPEEVQHNAAMAQTMQEHQAKINEAVERLRLAKAKGLKAAASPKVLEDLMFIMGV